MTLQVERGPSVRVTRQERVRSQHHDHKPQQQRVAPHPVFIGRVSSAPVALLFEAGWCLPASLPEPLVAPERVRLKMKPPLAYRYDMWVVMTADKK